MLRAVVSRADVVLFFVGKLPFNDIRMPETTLVQQRRRKTPEAKSQ
jgi:hypothetical protein